jgi:hypothetical protein
MPRVVLWLFKGDILSLSFGKRKSKKVVLSSFRVYMFFFPCHISLSLLLTLRVGTGQDGLGIGRFETWTHTLRVVKFLSGARLQCAVSTESLVGRGGYFVHGWINIVIH